MNKLLFQKILQVILLLLQLSMSHPIRANRNGISSRLHINSEINVTILRNTWQICWSYICKLSHNSGGLQDGDS